MDKDFTIYDISLCEEGVKIRWMSSESNESIKPDPDVKMKEYCAITFAEFMEIYFNIDNHSDYKVYSCNRPNYDNLGIWEINKEKKQLFFYPIIRNGEMLKA